MKNNNSSFWFSILMSLSGLPFEEVEKDFLEYIDTLTDEKLKQGLLEDLELYRKNHAEDKL